MKNIVNSYVEKFRENHRRSRRMASILLALALVVAAGVFWQLHSTGIALTNETYCGLEEHTHSEDCYEEVLVCGLEESEGHTHSGDCYETVSTLTCGLEESEGHTHSEACYETEKVLTCGLEESEGHTHSEDCYEEQLACGLEEHTHTVECLSDETADVETASDWEADLPGLTGIPADDVVAIAESQLGYTESTKNFTLAEDGTTRQGYTRYGAWYGNEYGGWDAMFASFCLYYAGVDENDFPQASGAYAWIASLKEMGLYASAGEDTPLPGDLVFFDTDEDGKADRVGIVTEVDEEDGSLTVIEGDYSENEDDADAVCETEYDADSSAIVGYGFLPSSDTAAAVSEDGETEEETEEETEKNMLTAAASSDGALLSAASTGTELDSSYYEVKFTDVTYADGTVKATLYLNLIYMIENGAFSGGNYNYIYYIDANLFGDTVLTKGKTTVYASDNVTVAYYYEIKYDSEKKQYYVEFEFNDTFINSGKEIDELYFSLSGTVDEDKWEKDGDGNIIITFGGEPITIYYDNITFTDDSETTLSDINVEKFGTYDAASSTISYTVTVSSVNGTGDEITLSDLLTLSGSLSANTSTVTATVTLYDGNGTDDTSDDEKEGEATNYTLYLDRSATLTLNALDAGQYYTITYSVAVNTGSDLNVSQTATNKISVSTEDSNDREITDEYTDTTNIKKSLVSKSGSYNSEDGTITWTITVNASRVNIAGYSLTDSMLADATSDIIVTPDDGYTRDGETITFSAVNDTDGDETPDSNTNTYTITYTTSSDQTLGDNTVTNTATLNDGKGGTGEATVTVNVYDGSLTKANTNDSTTEVDEDGTITLSWTSSLTVPTGGIASGTEILDYLGDQWNGYQYGVPTTHQWYTYGQIKALYNTYFANGIIFTGVTDETTYKVDADNFTMEAYYFSDKTDTSGEWITYQTLADEDSTYKDGYFTAWKITFKENISFGTNEFKLTLNYNTTADSTVVDGVGTTSYTYSNYINVGDLSARADYTYENYAKVVKTDGNGKSDNSLHIITDKTDNTLTWIVKVYIAKGSNYDSVTVTDTLPEGVELDSISIKVGNNGSTVTVWCQSDAWVSSSNNVEPVITDDSGNGQIVTLTFVEDFYNGLESTGGYINITYTCKITDTVMSKLLTDDGSSESFKNEVKATYTSEGEGTTDLGDDSQTQAVTYEEPETNAVNKSYYWDNDNDRLTYYVLLNPDGEDLLEDSEELTFTDIMDTYTDGEYGAIANLIQNSVTFYTLTELTGGSWSDDTKTVKSGSKTIIVSGTYTYTDSLGGEKSINYIAGSSDTLYVTPLTDASEVSSATVYLKTAIDIAWTYEEKPGEGIATNHIITATVPDSTRLLVEYAYQITYAGYTGGSGWNFNISNTANLSGSASDTTGSNESYTEVDSDGGASYRQNFTLTKVDVNNYGTTLAGATYLLYEYDGTAWVDTGNTYTADENGQITFSLEKSGIEDFTYTENTAYYLVESVAPEGYLLDSTTKFYFYWSSSDAEASETKYPSDWSSLTTYDLATASHTVIATNTPASTTSVTVEKAWVDEDGNVITSNVNSPESITFELYRYTANSSGSESGGSSDNTVTVYWNSDSTTSSSAEKYSKVGTVAEGEDAVITVKLPGGYTTSSCTVYIGVPYQVGSVYVKYYSFFGEKEGTITVPASSVTGDIYIFTTSVDEVSVPAATGNLTLTKTFDSSTPDTLEEANVTFTVTDSSGKEVSDSPITYSQMTSGSYIFDNLPVGTYTITESNADVSSGYTRTTTWKIGNLTYTGNSCSVTVSEGETTVNVNNSYTEGVSVVDPTGAVKVGEYTISAANGWTTSVSGLPETDSDGNTYYYYVKEVVDSGYSVYSYTNNEGVNTGTITITNQTAEAYALPSTGGLGTDKYTLTGLLLCGGAGCLFFRRRRQLRKSR